MLKKLDILGLELDNYTVREAMMNVEIYLNSNVMNTIETISMSMLEKAGADEMMCNCLQNLDLALIGEKEILVAAGVNSTQRMHETCDNEFFYEFMKRIIRNKKTVYLIGEKNEQIDRLASFLSVEYEKLQIVGQYAMENCPGDLDNIVNAINVETPSVILSVLPSPAQEQFLTNYKGKLSAKIWYGLGENYAADKGKHFVMRWVKKLIYRKQLTNKLNQYKKEN